MATNTYVALDKKTVTSNVSFVEFTSIPQTYTDLVLEMSVVSTSASGNYIYLQYNGDTGSNYSTTIMSGTGTSAVSTRFANRTNFNIDYFATPNTEVSTRSVQIMNYSNTTTNKTGIVRSDRAGGAADFIVGRYGSTSAITSIKVTHDVAQFAAGTTFSLYGIRAEGVSPAPKATGGAIYSDSTYYYHAFGASGTFTPNQSLTADILVVAGGGPGGGQNAGGGGAGGLLTFTSQSLTAQNYTCTVGAGGTSTYTSTHTNGGDSQFGGLTLVKGGGAGGYFTGGSSGTAQTGGSGGGAAGIPNNNLSGGSPTSGQGNSGGSTTTAINSYAGGGGGGAGAAGSNPPASEVGGAGGAGATSALLNAMGAATGTGQLSSSNYYYAGGGGGGGDTTNGSGGLGGGGAAAATTPTAGRANTGGGGGAARGAAAGGSGGSGIVVIRYAKA